MLKLENQISGNLEWADFKINWLEAKNFSITMMNWAISLISPANNSKDSTTFWEISSIKYNNGKRDALTNKLKSHDIRISKMIFTLMSQRLTI